MKVIQHLVLVPIHPSQCADVGEYVLDGVGELEGVDISETVLNVGVNDELG